MSDKLTPRQKTILLILAGDPCISVRRIAAMVGKQTRTIQRDIETLQKIEYYNHRLLERVGGDKWGKWQLNILWRRDFHSLTGKCSTINSRRENNDLLEKGLIFQSVNGKMPDILEITSFTNHTLILQTVAVIDAARTNIAHRVSATTTYTYWEIGKLLHDRKLDSKYGASVVKRLSSDLQVRYPKIGLSTRQLWNMKAFYEGTIYMLTLKLLQSADFSALFLCFFAYRLDYSNLFSYNCIS